MELIYAQQDLSKIKGKSIFLAGPTPRREDIESWRPEAIKVFEELGFEGTILIPEMKGGFTDNFEYADQIDWETRALHESTVIMFWIPRVVQDMEMPALTTNFELGEWLNKDPKKITLGWPVWADKMNYIEHRAKKSFVPVYHDLKTVVRESLQKVKFR